MNARAALVQPRAQHRAQQRSTVTDPPISPNVPKPDQIPRVPRRRALILRFSWAPTSRLNAVCAAVGLLGSGSAMPKLQETADQSAFQVRKRCADRFLLLIEIQKLLLDGLAQTAEIAASDGMTYTNEDLRARLDQDALIDSQVDFAAGRGRIAEDAPERARPRSPAGAAAVRMSPRGL